MLKSREYIGISLEGDHLRIARVRPGKKNGIELIRLDKLTLIEPIRQDKINGAQSADQSSEDVFSEDEDLDSIFGFDDEDEDSDEIEEIDLSDIEDDDENAEFGDPDLVEEAAAPRTNEELLVRYLDDVSKGRVHLGLNIESGNTIFQVIKNNNFNELKKKEVEEIVTEKLEAIYGRPPHPDNYDYLIRKDGNLIIASVDEESHTLQMVNRATEIFNRSYFVEDVVPDEAAMVGLYRNHYENEESKISGLIQLGPKKCRMVFVRGHEILQVSPVISEGTESRNFLNTIFSKILFQLDTGEIPGVDRFIIFNNTTGDKATDFFRKNFPDLRIENFQFNQDLFSAHESLKEMVPGFTTTIGVAAAAAGVGKKLYPDVTFLPEYVSDKQKVFKLHWHGFLLLILIGLSPVVINHFYQQNAAEIESMSQQEQQLQGMIQEVRPLVQESEELSMMLGDMQTQLELLTDLSRDNIRWTVTFDRFNQAVQEVGGMWINSFRQNDDVIMVDGYSLTRNNIPELANKFPSVTLLTVRREEIRERDIFYFNMMIRRVVEDEAEFTPQQTDGLDDIF
ncbi:MAG: hypothetical protein JJU46_00710 [Balneolaceae bacterium]|nr:hypothetical protein [Balneolaceae bacterium]MCH8547319.1 hypothetical protein [Balneolaceae bacterium]